VKTLGCFERKQRTYDNNCGTWASAQFVGVGPLPLFLLDDAN